MSLIKSFLILATITASLQGCLADKSSQPAAPSTPSQPAAPAERERRILIADQVAEAYSKYLDAVKQQLPLYMVAVDREPGLTVIAAAIAPPAGSAPPFGQLRALTITRIAGQDDKRASYVPSDPQATKTPAAGGSEQVSATPATDQEHRPPLRLISPPK